MPRRLVAVHPNVDLYGSDRMFLAAVQELPTDGDSVTTVVSGEGLLTDELDDRGIAYECLSFPVLRKQELSSPIKAALWIGRCASAALRLAIWLRVRRIHTVYVSTIICPVWALAARLAGCQLVVHLHESEAGMPALLRGALLSQLRIAHVVIANSNTSAEWAATAGRTVRSRTTVVFNGVAEPVVRSEPEWSDEASQHVVIVGRLNKRKGQHLAISVVAALRADGLDVGLTIIGDTFPGYESYERRLHQQAEQLGVGRNVTFKGFITEPGPYLCRADLVMVPSSVESFGNAAVEAMLAGAPVLASNVQGLTETIIHGKTGILVAVNDIDAFTQGARALLMDRPAARALAERGRAEARRRFSTPAYGAGLRQAIPRYPAS